MRIMDKTNSIQKTSLPGVLKIIRQTFPDDRGFFREVARITELEKEVGQKFVPVQLNHARSSKNTLRGIHAAPWNKLIYVISGEIQCVLVDFRQESQTFGRHESFFIGNNDKSAIYLPAWVGNSYLVLSENADYIYLTDQEWKEGLEKSVIWNDPDLAIDWKLKGKQPMLSERDKTNPAFRSFSSPT